MDISWSLGSSVSMYRKSHTPFLTPSRQTRLLCKVSTATWEAWAVVTARSCLVLGVLHSPNAVSVLILQPTTRSLLPLGGDAVWLCCLSGSQEGQGAFAFGLWFFCYRKDSRGVPRNTNASLLWQISCYDKFLQHPAKILMAPFALIACHCAPLLWPSRLIATIVAESRSSALTLKWGMHCRKQGRPTRKAAFTMAGNICQAREKGAGPGAGALVRFLDTGCLLCFTPPVWLGATRLSIWIPFVPSPKFLKEFRRAGRN